MTYYSRYQRSDVEKSLNLWRILLISGPRQCGKTTLSKTFIGSNVTYRTLDDITLLQSAEIDPHGFVKQADNERMIIDEIQRVPILLQALKKAVDEDNRPGQYILTGSANIQAIPSAIESLAGRLHKIRLRPLTAGEILNGKPRFLETAFAQEFNKLSSFFDRDQILEFCFRGGFPEVLQLDSKNRKIWHQDYIHALIDHDLQEIKHINRFDAMRELVKITAAWSSKFMDISSISSGLSLSRPTVESYMNALEALYLIDRVPPWTQTDYERVGKQSKLFMADSGLMASILGWSMDQVRFDSDRPGKLIETFLYNEIATLVDCSENKYRLFHYRDRQQREIDFLVEREDGHILGLEIKAGSNVGKNDFKHLKWFQTTFSSKHPFVGIVLYTGEHVVPFGQNLWAIPMGALWV